MDQQAVVRHEMNALVQETGARVKMVGGVVGLLWGIQIVNFVLGGHLVHFGIAPRSIAGLVGILAAPFIHAGWGHLIANTIPLLALGILATSRKAMDFLVVALFSGLVSGLGVWLFGGSGTVVVGASGIIFGFLGFLMGRGIFERRVGAILLSLLVTFLFGGMLWGVLPLVAGAGVSWQAHLFGFIGGMIPARILGRELRKKGR